MHLERKRIAAGLVAGIIAEIANKLFPLLTLHIAATKLGVTEFGRSQFVLWLIDMAAVFVIFGYGSLAPLLWRDGNSSEERSRLLGMTMLVRAVHALLASIALMLICYYYAGWNEYLPLLLPSLFAIFSTAFDMVWALSAMQKLTVFSVISLVAKTLGLILILCFVNDDQDALIYMIAILGANAAVNMGSCLYVVKKIGVKIPHKDEIKKLFSASLPYALSFALLTLLDRFDVFIVEYHLGNEGAGSYIGPSKIAQSFLPFVAMINGIFYSEVLAVFDKDSALKHLQTSLRVVLLAVLPIIIGVWFVDADILGFVLDDHYRQFGKVLSLLSQSILPHVFLLVFGMQVLLIGKKIAVFNISIAIGLALGALMSWYSLQTYGLLGVAGGVTFGKWVTAILTLMFAARVLKLNIATLLLPLVPVFFPAGVMAAALYFIHLSGVSFPWILNVSLGGGVYCLVIMILFKSEVRVLLRGGKH
jgi:O-antigen/teichoic acid export membrane protein